MQYNKFIKKEAKIFKNLNKQIKKHNKKHQKLVQKIQLIKTSSLVQNALRGVLWCIMFLSLVIFGMVFEYRYNTIDAIYNIYCQSEPAEDAILSETSEHHQIEYYEFSVSTIEASVKQFIRSHVGNGVDTKYVENITGVFMRLLNEENENKHLVLYYIALCSVESNFRMSSRSSAGACGISQIMPNIWSQVIKENYGFNKEQLYIDPYANIYSGYRIWDNYRRKNGNTIAGANKGYLGANNAAYTNKINYRYKTLISLMLSEVLKNDIKIASVKTN